MSKKRLSGAVKKNPTPTKSNFRNDGGQTDAFIRAIFPGESEMARRMRDFDWSTTELGPPQSWPENLRITARICLTSRFPIVVWWGPNFRLLYNDAYIPFLGEQKHPYYLGQPGRECWQEIWETIGPMLEGVYRTGVATWSDDSQYFFARNLPREEVYVTFTYGPILSADGLTVEGIFCPCTETTEKIVAARRLDTLRKLGVQALETRTVKAACEEAARVLAENSHDIPFAAIYLVDSAGTCAELKSLSGFSIDDQPFPSTISVSDGDIFPWPLASTLQSRRAAETSDLTGAGLQLPGGPWPEPASKAVVLPIFAAERENLSGLAVLGLSPRRVVDDAYRTYFDLIAGHIGTAISDAKAYEAEQKRAEALAELDRAKTAFFSNVSHEFRTPLTLMLGPLEDELRENPSARDRLEIAHRNSLRLLKLVNTLLDFSRIEAGRIEASYEPIDLATFTAELASVFRSAIERAGLRLVVDCPPLDEVVYVDREMWEKIVLNLLSNAFKFTFEGEIEIGLRIGTPGLRIDEEPKRRNRGGAKRQESAILNPRSAILTVRDTGTGIPAEEIPRLFERFHRIKGAHGRTFEGSGIGLALVHELAKLHGGTARVESEVDRGSIFTVSIPLGKAHLPSDRIGAARTLASTELRGEAYVEEAMRWLLEEDGATGRQGDGATGSAERHQIEDTFSPRRPIASSPRPRVLLADDNADMREYLRRLLGRRYEVEAVADGLAALRAARERAPDLVLTDVMMPGLDGFELLKELRADERLKTVPIILLSARAGEESRVEGMEAGADDYLIKPFSARELLARVESHLKMAQLRGRLFAEAEKEIAQRKQAEEALRESEERFRQLLENLPAGAYTCDADGLITYYNPRAVEVWGRKPKLNHKDERFCGSFKLYSSDGALIRHDQCWTALAIKEDKEYNGREVVIERPDGSRVTGLAHINPIHDAAGKLLGAVNIVVDISERKRAEAALIESEERFRYMADNAPALIWVTSPTRCEFVNREYLEFLGVGEEEVLGDNWAKFVHPEDREDYVSAFRDAVSSRSRFEGEFRFRRHDGEYRWMQSVGMPRFVGSEFKGYVGSSLDIHERKLTETAMAQMAALVESSHAAIISKDLNGIIRSWNQGAERLFGYTAEEVIGESVTILFPPDRAGEEPRILERLRRGERVDHYETVRRRKDGYEIDISLTVSPIRDKTGKVIGASKIARDISERKRKEAEREELLLRESAARAEAEAARAEAEAARAEAEAANSSKDEFLAVVSHELRSPLNAILGYNRMLRERHSDESQLKRSCDVIERNARTQLQLIEDLLDTARIGSGKLRLELRKLDIIPALVDALDIVRPAAEAKGVRLRIAESQSSNDQMKIPTPVESEYRDRTAPGENQSAIRNPQSAIVLGDAARLQQIVCNLLSNAIKFTPAGGSVELRAERAEEHIRIIVSDSGKGIHPDFMPHIFDRFQQRDSLSSQRAGGLGLGLALVKHLTELHGGKVEAMSEGAGCGSTFTVTLPLVEQIELAAAEIPALAAILTGGEARTDRGVRLPAGLTIAGVRVLVIDDHQDAREMLAEFLSLQGAVVTTASSGAEALMVLSNPPGGSPPDIMLCDIAMPGEDGYTALRRVRALEEARGVAAAERIPAIALTALTGSKERLRALSAGFRLHVAKPVDPVELMFTIANALGMSSQDRTLH